MENKGRRIKNWPVIKRKLRELAPRLCELAAELFAQKKKEEAVAAVAAQEAEKEVMAEGDIGGVREDENSSATEGKSNVEFDFPMMDEVLEEMFGFG
jgi:hypothetical protein